MSLIARQLESSGLPTVAVGSALDILEAGQPPRAVFVDYPLGHTTGKPFDKSDNRLIVEQALDTLESASHPGTLVTSSLAWSDDHSWRESAMRPADGDTRQARDETPQYQYETDRKLAEDLA